MAQIPMEVDSPSPKAADVSKPARLSPSEPADKHQTKGSKALALSNTECQPSKGLVKRSYRKYRLTHAVLDHNAPVNIETLPPSRIISTNPHIFHFVGGKMKAGYPKFPTRKSLLDERAPYILPCTASARQSNATGPTTILRIKNKPPPMDMLDVAKQATAGSPQRNKPATTKSVHRFKRNSYSSYLSAPHLQKPPLATLITPALIATSLCLSPCLTS